MSVWVDGALKGRAPLPALELEAGWHEVKLIGRRGRSLRRLVWVSEGRESSTLALSFSAERDVEVQHTKPHELTPSSQPTLNPTPQLTQLTQLTLESALRLDQELGGALTHRWGVTRALSGWAELSLDGVSLNRLSARAPLGLTQRSSHELYLTQLSVNVHSERLELRLGRLRLSPHLKDLADERLGRWGEGARVSYHASRAPQALTLNGYGGRLVGWSSSRDERALGGVGLSLRAPLALLTSLQLESVKSGASPWLMAVSAQGELSSLSWSASSTTALADERLRSVALQGSAHLSLTHVKAHLSATRARPYLLNNLAPPWEVWAPTLAEPLQRVAGELTGFLGLSLSARQQEGGRPTWWPSDGPTPSTQRLQLAWRSHPRSAPRALTLIAERWSHSAHSGAQQLAGALAFTWKGGGEAKLNAELSFGPVERLGGALKGNITAGGLVWTLMLERPRELEGLMTSELKLWRALFSVALPSRALSLGSSPPSSERP